MNILNVRDGNPIVILDREPLLKALGYCLLEAENALGEALKSMKSNCDPSCFESVHRAEAWVIYAGGIFDGLVTEERKGTKKVELPFFIKAMKATRSVWEDEKK